MTPVQAAALPAILAGKDVRVQAKPAAVKRRHSASDCSSTLTLLCSRRSRWCCVRPANWRIRSLVSCVVWRAFWRILNFDLCGGQPFGAQRDSLQHAPHIIVATPGVLLDHLQKGTVSLDAATTLVMDEADRMLDMGFSDAIDEVIRFAPASRQTLLFSATWPEAIAAISGRVQNNPQTIEIDAVDALPAIEQQFLKLRNTEKSRCCKAAEPASARFLCGVLQYQKDCQTVCDSLNAAGQSALSLHGDLEQRDRDQTLVRFANGARACW